MPLAPPPAPKLPTDPLAWFHAGNPAILVLQLRQAVNLNLALAAVLPGLLRNFALFHGLVALACVALAMSRLRPVAVQQLFGTPQTSSWAVRHGLRPSVGRHPLFWKEIFAEPGMTFNWFGRTLVGLIIVGSFVPAVAIVFSRGQGAAVPFLGQAPSNLYGGYGIDGTWFNTAVNTWVRTVGTLVACLTLLGVAARAAGSVSSERDRQTLDSLLSCPLPARTILRAKWLGSVLSVRWAGLWLAFIWLLGLVTGGLDPFSLPWLFIAWGVYASFLAVLGLWFSVVCRTTLRATLWTLATAAALSFGHWVVTPLLGHSNAFRSEQHWLLSFQQVGLTKPFALSWLAFRGDDFHISFLEGQAQADPWTSFLALIVGLFLWAGAATVLWGLTWRQFERTVNRASRPARVTAQRQEMVASNAQPARSTGDGSEPSIASAPGG